MATILNCLDRDNMARIGGNHFEFKPNQMKYFHDKNIAQCIDRLKREDGFILLPEEFDELSLIKDDAKRAMITTDEHKATLKHYRDQGLKDYVTNLRRLIYNATVSMQKDLDRAGYKYDARVEANSADLNRLRELSKYQAQDLDTSQQRIDEFKELEKKVADTSKG